MALQSSGQISFQDIQDEFGGSHPIQANEYYRNGGLVTSNNSGVPTSGQIGINAFYGTQGALWSGTMRIGNWSSSNYGFLSNNTNQGSTYGYWGTNTNRGPSNYHRITTSPANYWIWDCYWNGYYVIMNMGTYYRNDGTGSMVEWNGWTSLTIGSTTFNRADHDLYSYGWYWGEVSTNPFGSTTVGTAVDIVII